MQALVAPCYLGHSPNASAPQSASQANRRRRVILPASSPFPPGGTTVNGLLLGCIQASTLVEEIIRDTQNVIDIRCNHQSFISSFESPSLEQSCLESTAWEIVEGLDSATGSAKHLDPSGDCAHDDHQPFTCNKTFNVNQQVFRNLTRTVALEHDSMSSAIYAPGSPPELTESRSSKSSSYGSHFSGTNEFSAEITNFEEIGLEDDDKSEELPRAHSQHNELNKVQVGGRPVRYDTTRRPSTSAIVGPQRTIPEDAESRSARLGSTKRGLTSTSLVALSGQNIRPRSSSPPKRMPRPTSGYSIAQATSLAGSSPVSSLAPSRRGSWQPPRKTIKEIEAEYHDSDDELPDDASLWNVPVSPYPSAGISPRSSFRGSPERESGIKSPQPIPLEHTQSTPEHPPRRSSLAQSTMRHRPSLRSTSSAVLSRSHPNSPQMLGSGRNIRAKSWNLAMADLSPEARVVSEHLEFHADRAGVSNQKPYEKPNPNIMHRSSAPSAIQLPPIQRGALDFMPISKEKEAILSRTRPSWLPPKDPKEEKKHLKEYQRMMAASIEAEKKRESKLRSIQSQYSDTRESLDRIWDYYIDPTTDITAIDRRVFDLCWRGISAKKRGKVWQRAIGNPLGLSHKTYHKALERARTIKSEPDEDLGQHERKLSAWFVDIDRDAETAFPELKLFQRQAPLRQALVDVCEAYTCYRSDVGYLYGIQLVAALILLQLSDPCEAFILMANCLNSPIPHAFQTSDIVSTHRAYSRIVSNLAVKFPRLHSYLFNSIESGGLGLTPEEILEPMCRTMFSNGLDLDRLSRVWDIWVFEGDRAIIRTAVAVLGSLQSEIFDITGDIHLKRRNVQEMLGWGPFNRHGKGAYWRLDALGGEEQFVNEIEAAGKLDYTGH